MLLFSFNTPEAADRAPEWPCSIHLRGEEHPGPSSCSKDRDTPVQPAAQPTQSLWAFSGQVTPARGAVPRTASKASSKPWQDGRVTTLWHPDQAPGLIAKLTCTQEVIGQTTGRNTQWWLLNTWIPALDPEVPRLQISESLYNMLKERHSMLATVWSSLGICSLPPLGRGQTGCGPGFIQPLHQSCGPTWGNSQQLNH